MRGLPFTFGDAQQFGVGGQVSDGLLSLAALVRLSKEIHVAIDQRDRDGGNA